MERSIRQFSRLPSLLLGNSLKYICTVLEQHVTDENILAKKFCNKRE